MRKSQISTLAQIGMGVLVSTIPIFKVYAQTNNVTIPIIEDVDLLGVLSNITTWVLTFAGGIAVLYLIWGGIVYITGGEKGATAGKTMITNAIIGIAIIALSVVILKAVIAALQGGLIT